jgi:2-succinyl-6-hydroxy-2,4-cyclohexadiene-1-carboxylate synthase
MGLTALTWGSGPATLLLHGFTGSSASFDTLRPLLGPSLRAVVPDLPGHRRTPPATWDHTIAALGELLATHSVSGPIDVIAYSMGARLALGLALAHQRHVRRLVLISGAAGIDDAHERAQRVRDDDALAAILERDGLRAFLARWERHPVLQGLHSLPGDRADALRAVRASHDPAGLAQALRLLGQGAQPPLWSALPSLRVPTLLLAGEDDAKYAALARRLAQHLPDATVRLLPAGHSPHLEAPEPTATALLDFLRPRRATDPHPEHHSLTKEGTP